MKLTHKIKYLFISYILKNLNDAYKMNFIFKFELTENFYFTFIYSIFKYFDTITFFLIILCHWI